MKEKEDMIVWAKEIGADSIYFKSLSMDLTQQKKLKINGAFYYQKKINSKESNLILIIQFVIFKESVCCVLEW